jgi:hypothetical protein
MSLPMPLATPLWCGGAPAATASTGIPDTWRRGMTASLEHQCAQNSIAGTLMRLVTAVG